MGTPTQQIEAHIEQTGEALGSNLDELKQKVKAATDWRRYFRANPKVLPGIAFGGDLVFGPGNQVTTSRDAMIAVVNDTPSRLRG